MGALTFGSPRFWEPLFSGTSSSPTLFHNYKIKDKNLQTKFHIICPIFALTGLTQVIKKKLEQMGKYGMIITPKDVSNGFFDCLYYGFDEICIGWAGYLVKWMSFIFGEADRPSTF